MDAMGGAAMDALPKGQHFHPHGAFLGHIVPGSMFIIWGSWWVFSCLRAHLLSTPQRPYRSRAWFELPVLTSVPLEPIVKVLGCFIGINGELWFGQFDWYTNMFNADGTFNEGHMNNWQHAAMYFAYMISGFVDITGFYTELPPDTEQAALGIAFVTEGLLLGFHLKGAPIEVLVHKILVITIAGSAAVMFAEICCKGSVILTLGRALLVILQGIWFIQIGYILFKDLPAWDPHSMNSVMMAPALYCLDIMLLTLGALIVFLLLRLVFRAASKYTQLAHDEDVEDPRGPNSIFPRFTEANLDSKTNGTAKSVQLAASKRAEL